MSNIEKPKTMDVDTAKRALEHEKGGQPKKAAIGALVGGVATTTVAAGAFYSIVFDALFKHMKKTGKTISELNHPHAINEFAMDIAKKHGSTLTPLSWAMFASPFVGGAVGAWINTRRGNQAIDKKQAALDKLQETHWQDKISAEPTTSTKVAGK